LHDHGRNGAPEARWELRPADRSIVERLAGELQIPEAIAQVLVVRGYETAEEIEAYWAPSLDSLHSPDRFRDMSVAVDRIQAAIRNKERIRVYGDYDVDGISATTLLVKQLRRMKAVADFRIPSRFTDGYGIAVPAVEQAAADNVKLLITVDNGSVAISAHAASKEAGIDMIVCDHHQAGDQRPDVLAHLNPKAADASYPFPDLCGAGIAWKLAQALGAGTEELTQYAVLGTVADLVPLRGENRAIAAFGLQRLNLAIEKGDPGLNALVDVSGLKGRKVGGGQIGFQIGPRLNAAGRMEDASAGVELLLSTEPEQARQIAVGLERSNLARREIQEKITGEALAQAEESVASGAVGLVLAARSWHSGVIGIVASKIVETFSRPTILVSVDDQGVGKGSGRSIPAFDLYAGIGRLQELLDRFGGHTMAAGLTIQEERLPEFRRRFEEICQEDLQPEDLRPLVTCDAELDLAALNEPFVEILERGAPYGMGNRTPQFLVRRAQLFRATRVLKDRHLKFAVTQNGSPPIACIAFGFAGYDDMVSGAGDRGVDLAVRAEINEWQGRRSVQLQIRAIRESQSGSCEK
jgi:single-stranded-DNA-specific exonuclease